MLKISEKVFINSYMSTSMRHHSTARTYTDRAHNQDMDDDGGAETYGARRSARNSKQRHPVCMYVGVRCVREGKVEESAAHARQGHNWVKCSEALSR